MNYTSLIAAKGTAGSIANWVNYSDQILPLEDILRDAQALLWDNLRVNEMLNTGSFTLPQSSNIANVPIGWNTPLGALGVVGVWDSNQQPIKSRNQYSVLNRIVRDSSGNIQHSWPNVYCIANAQFLFDSGSPDQAISCTYLYWQQPAWLSAGSPTNFLTDRYPHLLRAACLAVAADYLNDDGKYQRYMQRLGAYMQQIDVADDGSQEGMQADADYSEQRI